jgi:hypothetical protein
MSERAQRTPGRLAADTVCGGHDAPPVDYPTLAEERAGKARRRRQRARQRACEAFSAQDLAVLVSMPLVEARRVWRVMEG